MRPLFPPESACVRKIRIGDPVQCGYGYTHLHTPGYQRDDAKLDHFTPCITRLLGREGEQLGGYKTDDSSRQITKKNAGRVIERFPVKNLTEKINRRTKQSRQKKREKTFVAFVFRLVDTAHVHFFTGQLVEFVCLRAQQ